MKRDSSGLSKTSSATQKPATYRKFNLADAVMVATIHTKDPTVWIHAKQDQTIVIHAPAGCTIESDAYIKLSCASCDVNASGSVTVTAPTVTVNGNLTVNGNISATGSMTSGSINLTTHTHTGDSGGTTSGPH